jgi:DNA modification methylase
MTKKPKPAASRDRIQELVRVKASELVGNAANWREHPDGQREAMRGILSEVGYVSGLIAFRNKKGQLVLVDGHLRKDISGDEMVPVQVVDLTEAEARKVLATYDPVGALATANAEALGQLLSDVTMASSDVMAMLNGLRDQAQRNSNSIVEVEIPALPKKTTTKLGDIYQLGEHRLICGDSTKAGDVARLMDKADLCFTSPPYNAGSPVPQKRGQAKKSHYANSTDDRDDYAEFLGSFTEIALAHCRLVAVNLQQLGNNKIAVIKWVGRYAERFVDRAIWYKGGGCPALAKNVMNSRFEDIWLLSQSESPHRFEDIWLLAPSEKPSRVIETAQFRGTVSNVIECGSNGANKNAEIHTATMPMAVAAYAIGNWSKRGASIYEPFCGCGTTLIAAEQLGRRCFGIELDPLYCDVIVARWEALTGQKAKRFARMADTAEPRRRAAKRKP